MTVNLSALAGAGQQFFDNNGVPLTGGKLYSYEAGTTTPQTTYTTSTGAPGTEHTNPIILDSAGRVPSGQIWLSAGLNYKFVLKTSLEVPLASWDNITGINGTGIATAASNVSYIPAGNFTETNVQDALDELTTSVGASIVGYLPAGTGAVATDVQTKLRESVSVKDFGAVGDGVTDDTAAIQDAIDTGRNVYFPFTSSGASSGYLITDTLTVSTFNQVMFGDKNLVENRPTIKLSDSSIATNMFDVSAASVTFRDLIIVGRGRTVAGTYGIVAERPTGVADVDLNILNCTIGSFNTAVKVVGRGLTTKQTNYVSNRRCFELAWPSPFVAGANPDQTALSGMRVYVVQNCRFHAMDANIIFVNTGANAANIKGVLFTGNYIDTLCAIYSGELHYSVISNNVLINCNQTTFPQINLSGGSNSFISNNLFYGMDDNGTGTTYELLIGVSLANCSNIQITNNHFNRVNRDVITIGANCSNIAVNGNIMKNVCLENATVATGRAPLKITAVVSGVSFCDNIIDTPTMTYNTAIVQSQGGVAVTNHTISGNIFNTASWKTTDFSITSTNARITTNSNLLRYDGDGAATQTITFTFKPYVAILCDMTSGFNNMVMITSKSTAGAAYGDINDYDVVVTGDFNINLRQYSIYAFA
jgi:hypothetical protein